MFKLFKRKKQEPPYDYGAAIARLSAACQKSNAYSVILPSLYFDMSKGEYVVHFTCAMKEYVPYKKKKYFYSVRRDEKIRGANLQDLLEYALTYSNYDDAFIRSPQENLPDGITIQIKNINRAPGINAPSLPSWTL